MNSIGGNNDKRKHNHHHHHHHNNHNHHNHHNHHNNNNHNNHNINNNNNNNNNDGPSKEKIIQYKKNLYSDDITKQLHAVSQLRILLSDEQQPPIDLVIRSNCVPRLIEILHSRESINLLFETAWVLTNICSGSHEHTMAVVEANGIECILSLLDLKDIAVLEQSIWVLGNIAGDGTNARDICLDKGVLKKLIKLAQEYDNGGGGGSSSSEGGGEEKKKKEKMPLSFQRNFVWTISNLVRGKPQPIWERVSCVIPIILLYLNNNDLEVLTDTCWALSYLSDGCNEHIQSILDLSLISEIDISKYLVNFLDKKSMNVLVPALRTCGNIVSGSDHQTQEIIDRGLLTKLSRLLRHPNHSVKKEAIWTVSNITAGNPIQIQCVIDNGLIQPLVDILTDYHADHDLVKECIWAISNATTGGTTNQLKYLSQYASIGLSRVMSHFPNDKKLQLVLLEGLDNLLSFTNENPIPLSQSPLTNILLNVKRKNKNKLSFKNQPHQPPPPSVPIDFSINEQTEKYIQEQEYKNIEISITTPNNPNNNDIYDITDDDDDDDQINVSDNIDDDINDSMDNDNDNDDQQTQNYVAYIMEQTEAHRILEDWYYDTNQDRDVAQLAKQIYTKYFNQPFQF